jgi:hypothetical protein
MRASGMLTLSREEVRIMVGSSGVVAMAVTQPPWPRRVPLSLSASPIVDFLSGGDGGVRLGTCTDTERKGGSARRGKGPRVSPVDCAAVS